LWSAPHFTNNTNNLSKKNRPRFPPLAGFWRRAAVFALRRKQNGHGRVRRGRKKLRVANPSAGALRQGNTNTARRGGDDEE